MEQPARLSTPYIQLTVDFQVLNIESLADGYGYCTRGQLLRSAATLQRA